MKCENLCMGVRQIQIHCWILDFYSPVEFSSWHFDCPPSGTHQEHLSVLWDGPQAWLIHSRYRLGNRTDSPYRAENIFCPSAYRYPVFSVIDMRGKGGLKEEREKGRREGTRGRDYAILSLVHSLSYSIKGLSHTYSL